MWIVCYYLAATRGKMVAEGGKPHVLFPIFPRPMMLLTAQGGLRGAMPHPTGEAFYLPHSTFPTSRHRILPALDPPSRSSEKPAMRLCVAMPSRQHAPPSMCISHFHTARYSRRGRAQTGPSTRVAAASLPPDQRLVVTNAWVGRASLPAIWGFSVELEMMGGTGSRLSIDLMAGGTPALPGMSTHSHFPRYPHRTAPL
jgi:hypothetical protein